jgi:hypothetical protein
VPSKKVQETRAHLITCICTSSGPKTTSRKFLVAEGNITSISRKQTVEFRVEILTLNFMLSNLNPQKKQQTMAKEERVSFDSESNSEHSHDGLLGNKMENPKQHYKRLSMILVAVVTLVNLLIFAATSAIWALSPRTCSSLDAQKKVSYYCRHYYTLFRHR